MRNPLKRSLSILLAVILVVGIFTVLPVASAGAIADTTDPWIFAVNDGTTYNLDGKWVRRWNSKGTDYEDDQFKGNHGFYRSVDGNGNINNTNLIYGDDSSGTQVIAHSRTQTSNRHYAYTVYVTGSGTKEHPYVFTPNMDFYNESATTFSGGSTVAIGYENTVNNESGVAVPGDGFKSIVRM